MSRLLPSRAGFSRLLLALSLAAAACSEKEPPLILPSQPVASGFQVDANAFPFPNYGGVLPEGDLDSSEVTRMFGRDGVCADGESNCRLTPIAREFATNANASMQGGRCEGFAVLTGLMYLGQIKPSTFGGTNARALMLEGNANLAKEISYWFSTQYLKDVVKTSTKMLNAAEAVAFLGAEYAKPDHDLYRIGMVRVDDSGRRVGGHAILATGVAPGATEGEYVIKVYDNNHPAAEREIKVNSKELRWEYQASTNPNQQSSLYVGTPANKNKLFLSGIKNRAGMHSCPFCRADATQAEMALSQIFTFGSAESNAIDANGQVAGEIDGQIVSDIPDAIVTPSFSEDLDQDLPPTLMLLPKGKIDLSIRRRSNDTSGQPIRVAAFLGGSVVGIENATLADGQNARIEVSEDHKTISFFPAPGSSATVFSAVEGAGGKQTLIRLQVPGDKGVLVASIGFDPDTGNATLSVRGDGDLDLPIEITRSSSASEDTIDGVVVVPTTGSTTLLVDKWMGSGESLPVATDRDGDGTADESGTLVDKETPNECAAGGVGLTACGAGTCTDTAAGFFCTCPAGFTGSGTMACADANECAAGGAGATACGPGTCANNAGAFACTCPAGYAGTGTTACTDVNECADGGVGAAACGTGTCANSAGSFACTCPAGFTGTGTTACADVDECANPESPGSVACKGGTCANSAGSYVCTCPAGFTGNGTTACTDVNECGPDGPGTVACSGGTCQNEAGGFTCTCPAGYGGTGTTSCADIDECAPGGVGTDTCGAGTCANAAGSYTCTCPAGYAGTGTTACTDVDECAIDGPGVVACGVGTCQNGPGTFACTCPPGFDGTGTTACADTNECAPDGAGTIACGPGTCQNGPGTFACTCPPGFDGTGTTACTPVNLCGPGGPGATACGPGSCENGPGGFTCTCPGGFDGTGTMACTDVDECAPGGPGGAACEPGLCNNTPGTFACTCPPGFVGTGSPACMDVDECAPGGIGQTLCGPGVCNNLPGAHACTCPPGFVGTGTPTCTPDIQPRDCEDIRATMPGADDANYTIDPDGPGPIAPFEVFCDMSGGGWTLMFDQDTTVAPGYRDPAQWLAGVTDTSAGEGQWSALQHLGAMGDPIGGYTFRITWDGEDRGVQWRQDSNPLVGRGTVSEVTMLPSNQLGDGPFVGLGSDSPGVALDGDAGPTAAWWAIGTDAAVGGGIQAYNLSSAGQLVATRTRLYVKRSPPMARDCGEILAHDPTAIDSIYLIDPDGPGTGPVVDVFCDMSHGGWTLISDQDVNVLPGYRDPALWLAGVNDTPPNGGQWSILQHLRSFNSLDDTYIFRMTWDDETRFIQWEQTTNPLDPRGGTVSNVLMTPANQIGTGTFQGLFNDGPAALDGEPAGAYYWAVGTLSTFGGGIPAYNASDTGALTAQRTRLYFKR